SGPARAPAAMVSADGETVLRQGPSSCQRHDLSPRTPPAEVVVRLLESVPAKPVEQKFRDLVIVHIGKGNVRIPVQSGFAQAQNLDPATPLVDRSSELLAQGEAGGPAF